MLSSSINKSGKINPKSFVVVLGLKSMAWGSNYGNGNGNIKWVLFLLRLQSLSCINSPFLTTPDYSRVIREEWLVYCKFHVQGTLFVCRNPGVLDASASEQAALVECFTFTILTSLVDCAVTKLKTRHLNESLDIVKMITGASQHAIYNNKTVAVSELLDVTCKIKKAHTCGITINDPLLHFFILN